MDSNLFKRSLAEKNNKNSWIKVNEKNKCWILFEIYLLDEHT